MVQILHHSLIPAIHRHHQQGDRFKQSLAQSLERREQHFRLAREVFGAYVHFFEPLGIIRGPLRKGVGINFRVVLQTVGAQPHRPGFHRAFFR